MIDLETRTMAAEKTVEVLKRKVRSLYDGSNSAIQRQLERHRDRELKNRQRQELMRLRTEELQRYNATLESEVKKRTSAMRAILDHVTFGFLIVNRTSTIDEGYTNSCHELLDSSDFAGKNFAILMGLDGNDAQCFVAGIEQVFDDVLPDALSLDQLRQRFVLPGGRVLRAEGAAIRGEAGEVIGVLMTISDITALEDARREGAENRMLVGILRQREAFEMFLADVRALLARARVCIRNDNAIECRRIVHTLKGNSACFGLMDVVEVIHALESEATIDASVIDRLEEEYRSFVQGHAEVLEIDYEMAGLPHFDVSEEQMSLLGKLAKTFRKPEASRLNLWSAAVVRRPVDVLLGPVEPFILRLAERLGKAVEISIEGRDVLIDPRLARPVFQNITHLIRNAIDHGIEAPESRGEKAPTGRISVVVAEEPHAYKIQVKDDGAGVDVDLLAERAVEKGTLEQSALEAMSREELVRLVFVDGLSTAETTTDISGRGVGMSAMRAAVLEACGSLSIQTARGLGTTVTILLPKPEAIATPQAAE